LKPLIVAAAPAVGNAVGAALGGPGGATVGSLIGGTVSNFLGGNQQKQPIYQSPGSSDISLGNVGQFLQSRQ
jgi:hypothetical protein